MIARIALYSLSCAFLLSAGVTALGQQIADVHFNTRVEKPAYSKNYPRVMFDEAHNNFHTATGRYKPFAELLFSDGYQVVVNRKPFAKESLKTFKVLVIANALGAEDMDDDGADQPAFTEEESDAVRDWVRSGGSLLLIADHAPFGGAAESFAKRFNVTMSKGWVRDPDHSQPENPGALIFSTGEQTIARSPNHPRA